MITHPQLQRCTADGLLHSCSFYMMLQELGLRSSEDKVPDSSGFCLRGRFQLSRRLPSETAL